MFPNFVPAEGLVLQGKEKWVPFLALSRVQTKPGPVDAGLYLCDTPRGPQEPGVVEAGLKILTGLEGFSCPRWPYGSAGDEDASAHENKSVNYPGVVGVGWGGEARQERGPELPGESSAQSWGQWTYPFPRWKVVAQGPPSREEGSSYCPCKGSGAPGLLWRSCLKLELLGP